MPTAWTIGTRINVLACSMHACTQLPMVGPSESHWEAAIYFFGNNFGGFLGKHFEIMFWSLSCLSHYSSRVKGEGLFGWEPMHWGLFVKNISSTHISKRLGIVGPVWGQFGHAFSFVLPDILFDDSVQRSNWKKYWCLFVTSLQITTHLAKQIHKWDHLREGLGSTR